MSTLNLNLHTLVVLLSTIATHGSKDCPPKCEICHSVYSCSLCHQGFYGGRCEKHCSLTCNNTQCITWSGVCVSCEDGWYGKFCEKKCGQCQHKKCTQDDGVCTPPNAEPCHEKCRPEDSVTGNSSDFMRNIIFILTGIGSAVCIGLIICCICVVCKRQRQRNSDIQMDILPKSQKLIPSSTNTTYPNTLRDPNRPQPLLDNNQRDAERNGPGVFHEAIADIGMAIPSAPPANQRRVRVIDVGEEQPPSYTSLFTSADV